MIDFTPYEHFKMKLLVRHSLDINKIEYQELSKMIYGNIGRYKMPKTRWARNSCTRVLVKFNFKDKTILAIYSKKFRRLVTVISKDWTVHKKFT